MVLQTMYIVHGRPGVEAKLVEAVINYSTKYSEPLQYEWLDENDEATTRKAVLIGKSDESGCQAFTVERKSGKRVIGPKITWALVKAEGWYDKPGPDKTIKTNKWRTMPEMMFYYRAASWFANKNCPELKLGMMTREEIEDSTIDVTPTLPPPVGTTGDKPGTKVYEFKTAEKTAEEHDPSREQDPAKGEPKGGNAKDRNPEPEKKAEALEGSPVGYDPAAIKEIIGQIKKMKSKADLRDLFLKNAYILVNLEGKEKDYLITKWEANGWKWGEIIEQADKQRNPAQAATSPEGQGNASNQAEKPQAPSIVDFGEGQEKSFAEKAKDILSELPVEAREGVLKLYGIREAEWEKQIEAVGKLAPGYHDAFLKRAEAQLDLEIQKKDGKK